MSWNPLQTPRIGLPSAMKRSSWSSRCSSSSSTFACFRRFAWALALPRSSPSRNPPVRLRKWNSSSLTSPARSSDKWTIRASSKLPSRQAWAASISQLVPLPVITIAFVFMVLQLPQRLLPLFLQLCQPGLYHCCAGQTGYGKHRLFGHHANRGETVTGHDLLKTSLLLGVDRNQMPGSRLGEGQSRVVPPRGISLPEQPGKIEGHPETAGKGGFGRGHGQTAVGEVVA